MQRFDGILSPGKPLHYSFQCFGTRISLRLKQDTVISFVGLTVIVMVHNDRFRDARRLRERRAAEWALSSSAFTNWANGASKVNTPHTHGSRANHTFLICLCRLACSYALKEYHSRASQTRPISGRSSGVICKRRLGRVFGYPWCPNCPELPGCPECPAARNRPGNG